MKADLFILSLLGALVLSCTANKDYYDEELQEKIKKENQAKALAEQISKYEANFVAKFGAVSPGETWDYSGDVKLGSSRAYTKVNITPNDGINFEITNSYTYKKGYWGRPDEYIVSSTFKENEDVYKNVSQVLPDEKEHTGKVVTLVAPSSSFSIYPVTAQGAYTYDLFVKVGNVEQWVFHKEWTVYDKPYCNGMAYKYTPSNQIYSKASMGGVDIEAPVGTPIEIYIKNVMNEKGLVNSSNPNIGTGSGNAIYVDATAKLKGESPENVVKYIGIEDNEGPGFGDKDYNDLVLMVVGHPDVPEEKIITNDIYTVETTQTKRYMVEDLGGSDDFDFNDVVVDVTEDAVTTHKVTLENGVRKTDEITGVEKTQYAIVRALGGTLDVTLKIGDKTWTKSANGFDAKTMYNTQTITDSKDGLARFDVTGWNPDSNNVTVSVSGSAQMGDYDIAFPKAGKVPMIIATETSRMWMGERQMIDWLNK